LRAAILTNKLALLTWKSPPKMPTYSLASVFILEVVGSVHEEEASASSPRKKPWPAISKAAVYAVVAVVVTASAVAGGYVLVRHERGLVISAYTDKDTYSPGENVSVWVEFTNYGFDSVHMVFNTSAMAFFCVHSINGTPVCGIPTISLQVITHKSIGSGETLGYGVIWDQRDEGEQVPHPARYYIVAYAGTAEYGDVVQTSPFLISG
jgi:hypothetical protein